MYLLLDFLNMLKARSLRDKKTLTQKALKLCEETGELAQVVLPLEKAYGTTYKKVEHRQILEEGCDAAPLLYQLCLLLGLPQRK